MSSPALAAAILVPSVFVVALVAYLTHIWIRYSPIVGRIFEETPVFAPLRVPPDPSGEDATFRTSDGLELVGTYFRTPRPSRVGVLVFCHEFLSDRWSFGPYCEGLRELGFDIFTFDFRNHGQSAADPNYRPLQWVSDLEVTDLRAALAYVRGRTDADPAGLGLFGISRGGGAALCLAAEDPAVWGVVTDGAFPTRGTIYAYVQRWASIYVGRTLKYMPDWLLAFAGWAGRRTTEKRLGRKYLDVERAVSRIAPRPWFAIHGEKDVYIGPDIARSLFAHAREPKELWIVPDAKHNRCREREPDAYRLRILDFFRRYAPRRTPPVPQAESSDDAESSLDGFAPDFGRLAGSLPA